MGCYLGTNWSAKYKVTLDCEKELIAFSYPEGKEMELKENSLLTWEIENFPHVQEAIRISGRVEKKLKNGSITYVKVPRNAREVPHIIATK